MPDREIIIIAIICFDEWVPDNLSLTHTLTHSLTQVWCVYVCGYLFILPFYVSWTSHSNEFTFLVCSCKIYMILSLYLVS
jgi:uncharacterized membrane protein YecN with MAPEG domain